MQTDRASVLWTTDHPGYGTVTATADDGTTISASAAVQVFAPSQTGLLSAFCQYQADLLGLRPHRNYSYSVTVDGQTMASDPMQYRFRTGGPGNFSFLVFGDSGSLSAEQQALVNRMSAESEIAFVVHVGDIAYPDGSFAQFETNHFAPNAPLMRRLCFFQTPGNHDYGTDSAAPYLAGVAQPASGVPAEDTGRYYSFDWSHTHFVSVDSNYLMTTGAQQMLDWLDADLGATNKHWRIVFLHHPPYPSGYHINDPICAAVARMVVPIVERHGVQLVLSGHEHGYERSFPLRGGAAADPPFRSTLYVISGGGGANLEPVGSIPQCALSIDAFHYLRVDVQPQSLRIIATGLDGQSIDEVRLGAGHGMSIQRVLSTGSYTTQVAAGSWVAMTGDGLAEHTVTAAGGNEPHSLDGTIVAVDGVTVPLRSVAPGEIVAQLPEGISGPAEVRVWTAGGSAGANIEVLAAAPSIVTVRAGDKPLHFANPVRPGAPLSLYLTGLGGFVESPSGLEVWLGKHRLDLVRVEGVQRGIARLDVRVPVDLDDGLYALQVLAGDVASRVVNVDVSARDRRAKHDRAVLKVEVRSPGPRL